MDATVSASVKRNVKWGHKRKHNTESSSSSSLANSGTEETLVSTSSFRRGIMSMLASSLSSTEEDLQGGTVPKVGSCGRASSINSFSPAKDSSAIYDKYFSSKSFDDAKLSRKEDCSEMTTREMDRQRQRHFGSRSSVKRLSRFKVRSNNQLPDYPSDKARQEGRSSKVCSTKSKRSSKRIRIGLFYTWSFAGQRQRKVIAVGESKLGSNKQLDRLWEEAAKTIIADNKADPTSSSSGIYETVNVSNKESSRKLMGPTKQKIEIRSIGKKAGNAEQSKRKDKRDDRPNSIYMNVYPYTTLGRQYSAGHPKYAPYHYNPENTYRTLPITGRGRSSNSETSNAKSKFNKELVNIQTANCYSQQMNYNRGDFNNYHRYYVPPHMPQQSSVSGQIFISPMVAQPTPITVPLYHSHKEEPRRRFSHQKCAFAWTLALTAVLILSLAIALFIQINRDNGEFRLLQEKLAYLADDTLSSTSSTDDLFSEQKLVELPVNAATNWRKSTSHL